MASAETAAPTPRSPAPRPRAFDASEGTPLDPLLNTTYDLNYPKVVPRSEVTRGAAPRPSFQPAAPSFIVAIDSATAQALETLRLLMAPGMSSRAALRRRGGGSWYQAFGNVTPR